MGFLMKCYIYLVLKAPTFILRMTVWRRIFGSTQTVRKSNQRGHGPPKGAGATQLQPAVPRDGGPGVTRSSGFARKVGVRIFI